MLQVPKNLPRHSCKSSGYSLIQMAIALLVFGLLFAGFAQIYTLYTNQQSFLTTQEKVEQAVQKLQIFRQANGYYPCPAPIDAARTGATYGTPSNCSVTTQAIGTCINGICIQSNTRNIGGVATVIRVRYGAIPFRALQMDEQDTFDAYGSRLSYALTENMGTKANFNELNGGIDIVNELGESLVEPASSAAFIVISHGQNRVGAVSALTGAQPIACPTGPAAANQLDAENCFNPANVAAAARFVNTFKTEGTGPIFDDIVSYFASAENKLWRRATNQNDITNMTGTNIGIGQFSQASPPSSTLTITQTTVDSASGLMQTPNAINPGFESGALRATNLSARQGICDQTGTKCFYLTDFMSNPSNNPLVYNKLRCTQPGQYPVGITSASYANGEIHAAPICRALITKCPWSDQSLIGLNSNGSPICSTVAANCPSQPAPGLCGQPGQSLPSGVNGAMQIISYNIPGAACAVAYYSCSNGSWVKYSSNESPATCTNAPISSKSCSAGYSGTYSGFTCGNNNSSTQCTCVGIPDHVVTTTCSSPFTGTKTKTCHQTCMNNVLQSEVCSTPTGTCSCNYTDKIDFQDCPAGQQRKASPSPAAFAETPYAWPTDVKKGVYRKLTINTSSCQYDSPALDSSNCECDGKPNYTTALKNPSDYPLVNPDYVVHEYCYEPKSGTRNVMDNGVLALAGVDYARAVMRTPKDPTTCTALPAQTTELDPAQFKPKAYRWKTSQAPLRTNEDKHGVGAKELDSSCICQISANAPSTCYKQVAGNKYDIYACSCRGD